MKTVYRVEHKESRQGPYRYFPSGLLLNSAGVSMTYSHNGCNSHPVLQRDGIWDCDISNTTRSGFDSVVSLRTWFKGWLRALYKNGFIIAVYRANYWQLSNSRKQLIFDLSSATLVRELPLIQKPLVAARRSSKAVSRASVTRCRV